MRLWRWLRVLAGAAILAVLLWRVGGGAFTDGLRVIDARSVAAALVIGLLTTVACAARWRLVVRRLGLRLPLGTAVGDYYRAQFLNTVLPGGVLGDVHRAVRHGRDSGDVGRGVRAVVIERIGGQVVLAAAGIAVLCTRPAALRDLLVPVAAVALVLAVVAVASRRTRLWRRLVTPVLTDVRLSRGTWPGVLTLSAVALAGHLALFLVSARVAGVSASLPRLLPLMILALVAMGLPVNVGGWGPREGVSAWAFGAAGLGATHGVTVAVVYGVLTFVSCLPGAVVLVVRAAQVQFEQRVVAEGEPAYGEPGRVAHPDRAGKAQARHPVAEQHRRDRDVQPLERLGA
jgi:uncharacterized membrane protein YbhN (UPF0104 family)